MHLKRLLSVYILAGLCWSCCILDGFAKETIVMHNGITRTDVPKLELYVLKMPQLEKLVSKSTQINVTAFLEQIPDSRYFRASDVKGNYAFYKLDDQWEFKKVDEATVPNSKAKSDKSKISPQQRMHGLVTDDAPRQIQFYEGSKQISSLPAPVPNRTHIAGNDIFYFFNGGRSVAFTEGNKLFVANDVRNPQLISFEGVFDYHGMFGDAAVDYFFTIQEDDKQTYFLNRFDPLIGKTHLHFASLGQAKSRFYPFGKIEFDRESCKVVVTSRPGAEYGLPSLIIDANTGKISARFALTDADALASIHLLGKVGGKYLATIGKTLFDLETGKKLAELPGLYEISARRQSKDGRSLIYATSSESSSLSMTKLVSFDLGQHKITGSITLPAPPQPSNMPPPGLREMIFLPNGNLMVMSATQGIFMDHDHVMEPDQ